MQNKTLKRKLVLKNNIKNLISKIMLTAIIFLLGMILVKKDSNYKNYINKSLYEKSIKFTKVKKLYKKYFGDFFSFENLMYEEKPVFNEKLIYSKEKKYKEGVSLTVSDNYMVPCLENGIVVYIGEKQDYGNTIIIEQENGIDVFYGNVQTDGIKLYDYIKKGEYIGQTPTEELYLIFKKNGETLNYKDYIQIY